MLAKIGLDNVSTLIEYVLKREACHILWVIESVRYLVYVL